MDASSKRIKREEEGVIWGEETSGVGDRLEKFLYEPTTNQVSGVKQSKLKPVTGLEWFCRQILREVTGRVVELSQNLEGVAEWEEWEPRQSTSARSSQEERKLWAVLEELDKAEYKADRLKMKKEKARVAKARAKMGASKMQPSILESFRATESKYKPNGVGGGSVNTLTGSGSVAASQSNTVTPLAGQECPGDSLRESTYLESNDASLVEPRGIMDTFQASLGGDRQPVATMEEPKASLGRGNSTDEASGEGGGSVNTLTGSVRVAASQSNTICQPDASLSVSEASLEGESSKFKPSGEGGGSVNTLTGSVSVAASQSNTVCEEMYPNECVRCSKLKSVRCRECVTKYGCAASKSEKQLHRGGVRENEDIKRLPTEQKKSSSAKLLFSSSKNHSTTRLKEYFNNISTNTNFGGKVGSGKNTPTKRKLCEVKQVSSLISKFSRESYQPEILPGRMNESESPAKRQRQ